MPTSKKIIQKVKGTLMLRGTSLTKIAQQEGVSLAFVSQVLQGKRKTEYIRKAIAKAAHLPADEIWQP